MATVRQDSYSIADTSIPRISRNIAAEEEDLLEKQRRRRDSNAGNNVGSSSEDEGDTSSDADPTQIPHASSTRHRRVRKLDVHSKPSSTAPSHYSTPLPHASVATTNLRTSFSRSGSGSQLFPQAQTTPSSSSLLSPAATPMNGFRKCLYWSWKVVQTFICILSFIFCGCCGGCCVPCRSSKRSHRRRRKVGAPAQAEYQSWTEDDDSEFEYERPPTSGRISSSLCKILVVFLAIFFAYTILFVRVVPKDSDATEIEVEFGFNDYISPIGLSIPNQLHSSFGMVKEILGGQSRPGVLAKKDGLRAHFPIVFVPGIVSTALEVWEGDTKCLSKAYFRQRLWGSALMLKSILLDSRCWLRHLSLDGFTGLDPEGIKLRAASGLEAADYLVGGFWVWAKLIENFSDVGYDTNSMFMAPYDWRLSFKHLQIRDYYFSKLKSIIEVAKLTNHNRKVVLISHSMGGNVMQYFLKWVESPQGGHGGPKWVDEHIESMVGIGVPWLGTPKVFSAVFSGEMKDTAELAPFLDYWRQRVVFSQTDVLNLMLTIRSLPSMMPKGGNVVWGDAESAPDDAEPSEEDQAQRKQTPPGSDKPSSMRDTKPKTDDKVSVKEVEDEIAAHASVASTVASAPVTTTTRQYLGQFVTFTSPIPWPFPNITSILEQERRKAVAASTTAEAKSVADPANESSTTTTTRAADGAENNTQAERSSKAATPVSQENIGELLDRLRDIISDSNYAKEHGLETKTEFNFEDAVHLLSMVAWPDLEFDRELYSIGYGAKQVPKDSWFPLEGVLSKSNSSSVEDKQQQQKQKEKQSAQQMELLDLESGSEILDDQRFWANPLETTMPNAPHLKLFCLYGVGRETERGYVYAKANALPSGMPRIADLLQTKQEKRDQLKTSKPSEHKTNPSEDDTAAAQQEDARPTHSSDHPTSSSASGSNAASSIPSSTQTPPTVVDGNDADNKQDGGNNEEGEPLIGARAPSIPFFSLNTSFHHPAPHIRSGVKLTDGDGTVPLISLGYMCVDGWKKARFNPHGMRVITREYRDLSDAPPILRSSTSVDHVDIMGNSEMIRDLLYITCIRTNNDTHSDHSSSSSPASGPSSSSSSKSGSTQEQATYRASDEGARFHGGTSPPSSSHSASSSSSTASATSDHGSDTYRGGGSLRASNSPIGELTWTEVQERIYSRILPIAEKVTQRFQKFTGVTLEDAPHPAPGSYAPLHPGDESEDSTVYSPIGETGGTDGDGGEWTEKDEQIVQKLLAKRLASARAMQEKLRAQRVAEQQEQSQEKAASDAEEVKQREEAIERELETEAEKKADL